MNSDTVRTDTKLTMNDPVAFFITWSTYGSWLPGDQRGWVEFHKGWKLPKPQLELECATRMADSSCLLKNVDRVIVEMQIAETCQYRNWKLRAVSCRTNHAHLVVSAYGEHPKKISADLKAWCSRRLIQKSNPDRTSWWAERGSVRWVWNQKSLATVVEYVNDCQGRKHLDDNRHSSQPDA